MTEKSPPDAHGPRSDPSPPSARRRLDTLPPGSQSGARIGAPTSTPAPREPRRRVLVVDDSAICLDATAMMLEDAGFEVVTVDTPFGLSSALGREAPDLILVDVAMPGLSGDKLVEITLRNRTDPRRCAIVLHSDRSEHDLRALARACGAAGYIRKTSDAQHLVREVERYLRG